MSYTFKPFSKITADLSNLASEFVSFEDSQGTSIACNHIEITQIGGSTQFAVVELSGIAAQALIGPTGGGVSASVSSLNGSGMVGHGVTPFNTTIINLPQNLKVADLVIKVITGGDSQFIITYGNIVARNQIGDQSGRNPIGV